MSTTPWTVQRSKRKQPATTPGSRKRARTHDDVGKENVSTSRSRDQKTLTQIKWVNSPETSFEDDTSMQEIEMVYGGRPRPKANKGGKLRKRNSTLTQMNWLDKFPVHQDDMMDDAEMLPEQDIGESTLIPQVDGARDSPEKSNKRKLLLSSSSTSQERETQEYIPPKRRKKSEAPARKEETPRRRSGRIASKVSHEPDETSGYVAQASLAKRSLRPPPPPRLEIQDSTEFDNVQTPTQARPYPSTPRRRQVILSSQTPETVTKAKTVHWAETSPSKTLGRTPLGEKSTNLQAKPSSPGLKNQRSTLKGRKSSPKRRKVYMLKEPSRDILERVDRVDDSQRDVYSFPVSSSTSSAGPHLSPIKTTSISNIKDDDTMEAVEIPPSSLQQSSSEHEMPSSPPSMETDGSLPELNDLISLKTPLAKSSRKQSSLETPSHNQASADDSVLVQDFGHRKSQNAELINTATERLAEPHTEEDDVMLLDEHISTPTEPCSPPTFQNAIGGRDNESELGSPVANDTQFNINLMERTSSPRLDALPERHEMESLSKTPTRLNRRELDELSDNGVETEEDVETPMPVPKLIGRLGSSAGISRNDAGFIQEDNSMLPPSSCSAKAPVAGTKVPLNDTIQESLSSSPLLPPVRPTPQRRAQPASIPRPSQLSTQEPTQNYFLPSMPPPTQRHDDVERMTIKDSSSIHLSQIPKHESQSQGVNLGLVDRYHDDIEDLDLDPSSVPQNRYSARKPVAVLRKETESSLKSIHPSSDSSRGSDGIMKHSSSPLPRIPTSHNAQSKPQLVPEKPQVVEQPQTDVQFYDSDATSSPISSPGQAPLKRKYDPIPGFDNETQSNFTEDGHITAAYIRRQQETGVWPDWFLPEPFQLPEAQRPSRQRSRRSG